MVVPVSKQYSVKATRVDKAAWLSFFSLGSGVWLTGPTPFLRDMAVGSPRVFTLLGALLAYLLVSGAVQVYMRRAEAESPTGEAQRLLTGGIFSQTRNPVYVAFLFPLAALALFSPIAALTVVLFYLGAMSRFVITHEEDELRARFGMKYVAYAARVPRWLL